MSIKADLKLVYEQCSKWDTGEVIEWLKKVQLSDAEPYFRLEGIDGLTLIQLNRQRIEKISPLTRGKKELLLKYLAEFEKDQERLLKSVSTLKAGFKPKFKKSLSEPAPAESHCLSVASDSSTDSTTVSIRKKFELKSVRAVSNPDPAEASKSSESDDTEYEFVKNSFGAPTELRNSRPLPLIPGKPVKASPVSKAAGIEDRGSNSTQPCSSWEPTAGADEGIRPPIFRRMTEPGDSDDSFEVYEEDYLNVDEVKEDVPPPIPERQRATNASRQPAQTFPVRQPEVRTFTSYPSVSSPEEPPFDSIEEKYEMPIDPSQRNGTSGGYESSQPDSPDIYEEPEMEPLKHRPSQQISSGFVGLQKTVPIPPSSLEQKQTSLFPSNFKSAQKQLPQPPKDFTSPSQMGRRGSADQRRGSAEQGKQPPPVPAGFDKPSLPPRLPHQQQPQSEWGRRQPEINEQDNGDGMEGECIYVDEDRVENETMGMGGIMEEVYDEVTIDESNLPKGSTSVSRTGSLDKQACGAPRSQPEKSNPEALLSVKIGTDTLRTQISSLKPTSNVVKSFSLRTFGQGNPNPSPQSKPFQNPPPAPLKPVSNLPQPSSKPLLNPASKPVTNKFQNSNVSTPSTSAGRNVVINSSAAKESSTSSNSGNKWNSSTTPKRHLVSGSEPMKNSLLRHEGSLGSEDADRASSSSNGSQGSDASTSSSEPPQVKKKSQPIPKLPMSLSSMTLSSTTSSSASSSVPSPQGVGAAAKPGKLAASSAVTAAVAAVVEPTAAPKETKTSAIASLVEDTSTKDKDPLSHCTWYCGEMGREEARRRVVESGKDGAFLVRKSVKGSTNEPYTLCLLSNSEIYNIHLRRREDEKFALGKMKPEELKFDSAEDLIKFYCNNPLKLFKNDKQSGEVVLDRTIVL